ncbi:MAG: hypothetical protein K6G04_09935 [Lachnospiraceae bacterium]|nr:hypothetical protein [Lachnospiraceae bacterium]
MGIIKNIVWNIRGAMIRNRKMKAPWSLQKKIIAGTMAGVLVIGGSTGAVLAHHFAGDDKNTGLAVEKLLPPTMAKIEVYEPTYVEIPNFVGMTVASDSLEKDLTLYFKGEESKARIEGVAFQVKLINPKKQDYLNDYLDEIDRLNKEIAAAKEDGSENDPYVPTEEETEADTTASTASGSKVAGATVEKKVLTAAQEKTEEQIAEKQEEAKETISANFDKLTIGEKLLLDKEVAIESYATALTAVDGKNYVDDDNDGMIYINKLDSGKYVACMVPTGFYDPSDYATEVTVKDKVEYKKVENIDDKVKDSSKVEDEKPAEAAPVEAVLQDTVAWVESSKTEVGAGYEAAKAVTLASTVSGENVDAKEFETTARRETNRFWASVKRTFALSTVRAAELNVSESEISLKVGESKTVTVTDATVTEATSSDTTVATATCEGGTVTIQAVGEGTATIKVNGTVAAATEGDAGAAASKQIVVTVTKNTTTVKAELKVPANATVYASDAIAAATGTVSVANTTGEIGVTSSSGDVTATISNGTVTIKAKNGAATQDATITYTVGYGSEGQKLTATTNVHVVGVETQLKDASGNPLFVDNEGKTAATLANYKADGSFYAKTGKPTYKYTGWQVIDGKTYFYNKDGVVVTGDQVIQGVQYSFNNLGVLVPKEGIDVSKWQGNIDWATASSYINFAVIRCGYRGESSRGLAIDPKFSRNVQGAKANGVRIGLYFYSTAVTEAEAVEEASLAVQCAQQAGGLSLPIYIDMEAGCQSGLSNEQRTAICNAFCSTVRNSGFSAGVYANKNWLTNKINTGAISGAEIWVAQYNTSCTYGGTKKMWQYTSKGSIPGISGNVDMNRRY